MTKIYLSGPVTGRDPKEAAEHFKKTREHIYNNWANPEAQVFVIDPIKLCADASGSNEAWSRHEYMRLCVSELVFCDGIALLQGWQKSKGALLELKLAQDLKIPVVYVEPPLDTLDELFEAAPEIVRYCQKCIERFLSANIEPDREAMNSRAIAQLPKRYLDPHGFEFIETTQEIKNENH